MSFVICVMEENRVTLASEDRAGIGGGGASKFVMTGGGRIKNVHVNDEILYAVVGRIPCADRMKAVVKGLQHLSFSSLVAAIPTIAQQTIKCEGNGARLTMTLAGWDAENHRMRGVIWNVWGDADDLTPIEVQSVHGAGSVQWVLGSGDEAQNLALNLMALPGIKVPECFPTVFAKLSASFPEIGNALTVNSVTRPENGKPLIPYDASSDSTYAKTITSRVSSGKPLIDFSEAIHLNKNLDNIPDGTRAAWTSTTQRAAAVDSSGNVLLKNVNQAVGVTSLPTIGTTFGVIAEMTLTITAKGNKILIAFSCNFNASWTGGTGAEVSFAIFRNGSQLSNQNDNNFAGAVGGNLTGCLTFIDTSAVSGTSYTYDVRAFGSSIGGGTATIRAASTARQLQVVELG
jgi:hypothetical protein